MMTRRDIPGAGTALDSLTTPDSQSCRQRARDGRAMGEVAGHATRSSSHRWNLIQSFWGSREAPAQRVVGPSRRVRQGASLSLSANVVLADAVYAGPVRQTSWRRSCRWACTAGNAYWLGRRFEASLTTSHILCTSERALHHVPQAGRGGRGGACATPFRQGSGGPLRTRVKVMQCAVPSQVHSCDGVKCAFCQAAGDSDGDSSSEAEGEDWEEKKVPTRGHALGATVERVLPSSGRRLPTHSARTCRLWEGQR